ncbi:TolC family protein [Salinimicrobium oceani]|uniref:TolC family protein n=1 Tax=Salinimicrobium oceani TaxID=2722702 RepID=A0ABX1CYM0_9FLAO|nr:TolC family protein [Salinimicrobium oceani]NJW52484.1 TolC family protein [Salinimicrobium oceani]
MNKISIVLLLFLMNLTLNAQEKLTAEEAIRIALSNNYAIEIARNELEIDSKAVSLGNAGMLPSIGLTANSNNSIQSTRQTRASGDIIEVDNAKNNNISYGAVADWTLFDGFRMFARYDQLKELEKLGEAELQQTLLSRVSDVLITYYDLVQQQQQLAALDSTRVISEQRLELAQNRFTIGRSSKLEVLNAQVDLNSDRTTILRQQELHRNTKIRLNELLARNPATPFFVEEDIAVDNDLLLPDLEQRAKEQNPALLAQVINRNITELELKQVKAGRYPRITANTGYIFSRNESPVGFTTFGRTEGFNYGFTARMNLFEGFNQNRNEKMMRLELENSELAVEEFSLSLQAQIHTAYQTYLTNLELMQLERENEAIARQNLEITLEKYRIGTIPTIEFRTAQLNYINARVRHSNAIFEAKLSEITLKELTGQLSLEN